MLQYNYLKVVVVQYAKNNSKSIMKRTNSTYASSRKSIFVENWINISNITIKANCEHLLHCYINENNVQLIIVVAVAYVNNE